jgi:MFS family permease
VPDKPKFYGWKLVAVLFFLDFINMGFPYYGGSVIVNGYMSHQLVMSDSKLGLGFTLLNLSLGIAAIVVAMSIVKFGLRLTFIFGSAIVCCASLFMATLATEPWQYLLAFGIINGAGISFATLVPSAAAVTRWFRRYRGRAMGLALSASGFAGLAAPFLGKLIRAHGGNWRLGFFIVAGAVVVSGLVAALFIRESPESLGQTVDGIPEADQAKPSRTDALATQHAWTASQAYGTSAYWLIAIAGICCTFPYFFLVAKWIKHLTGIGISRGHAESALALLTIGTLAGRWLGGILMDIMNSRAAFIIGLAMYFIASYLAIIARPEALDIAYASSFLSGAAYGWTFTCVGTMIAHYFGPKAFPKLYGMMTLLISSLASPAGAVGGHIHDVYSSYTHAFQLNCVIVAIGIIAISFAVMPTPRDAVPVPVSLGAGEPEVA